MRILIVNWELPVFDRTSGGLRLFTLLSLLTAAGAECDYILPAREREIQRFGIDEFDRYVLEMARHGINLRVGGIFDLLRAHTYNAVLFEFFTGAEKYGAVVRILQPQAVLVVDSVDLTYLRWSAMADVTGSAEDRARADDIMLRELGTYRHSDLVLTLTQDESAELVRQVPGVRTFEVPNIHLLPSIDREESSVPTVLFIGSFTHEPNIDAVKWMAREIWPKVLAACPDARLQVIGQFPPADLLLSDSQSIDLLGHVPSTLPYLASAWVSVAPLRFGAGMKGKVGEALAAGLPVVTTGFGAQGYMLNNGRSALIVDSSQGFADAVIALLGDAALRKRLGCQGKEIIRGHFSREAVAQSIPKLLLHLSSVRPSTTPWQLLRLRRFVLLLLDAWARHVSWRFVQK